MTGNILECESLGKSYHGVAVVHDMTFGMVEGEALALIGPNGAGKTTTLGMLTTAIRPTTGRATVLGNNVVRNAATVRASIGVLFQEPTLDDRMTPRETLRFHAALHNIPRRDTRSRIENALDWAGLESAGSRVISGFSGGMKRRVELARSLMHQPRLLVLDEPTLGLDPQGKLDLWARITALRSEGVGVLLTTHVLTEAEHCNRIGIIDSGRLVAIDTPLQLKKQFTGSEHSSLDDVVLQLTGHALNKVPTTPTVIKKRA